MGSCSRTPFTTFAGCLVASSLATVAVAQDPPQAAAAPPLPEVRLQDPDVAAWATHLRATGRELRWESVPWLPTFGEGLLEADRRGKPLLLWTMNGHPLACT